MPVDESNKRKRDFRIVVWRKRKNKKGNFLSPVQSQFRSTSLSKASSNKIDSLWWKNSHCLGKDEEEDDDDDAKEMKKDTPRGNEKP